MDAIFKKIASWLFLVGILLAVIMGLIWAVNQNTLADYQAHVYTLLAVLGFVVGILSFFAIGNITQDRVPTFLIAALILVGISVSSLHFTNIDYIGPYFTNISMTLAIFAAPAAGLLAIRAIWDAGKTEEIDIPKKLTK